MQLSLIIAVAIFAGCILIAVLFGQHFGQHNAEQSAPGKQTAPVERATPARFSAKLARHTSGEIVRDLQTAKDEGAELHCNDADC